MDRSGLVGIKDYLNQFPSPGGSPRAFVKPRGCRPAPAGRLAFFLLDRGSLVIGTVPGFGARHWMLCRLKHSRPGPSLDFWTKPKAGAFRAAVNHGPWHVGVAVKVGAGAIWVPQA